MILFSLAYLTPIKLLFSISTGIGLSSGPFWTVLKALEKRQPEISPKTSANLSCLFLLFLFVSWFYMIRSSFFFIIVLL